MNQIENVKLSGELCIEVRRADGSLKETRTVKNLVVNAGLALMASRLKDNTTLPVSHMALGQGVAAALAADTALGVEVGRSALSSPPTLTGGSISYSATFPGGVATGPVTEAGLFNSAVGGAMLCRTKFGVVTKEATDVMSVTWVVTIAAA